MTRPAGSPALGERSAGRCGVASFALHALARGTGRLLRKLPAGASAPLLFPLALGFSAAFGVGCTTGAVVLGRSAFSRGHVALLVHPVAAHGILIVGCFGRVLALI